MKLYNHNELKDSRIFFEKKPPSFLTYFIFFVIFVIVISLFVLIFTTKTYVVKAQGVVNTNDNQYVAPLVDGEITEIVSKEQTYVKEGDILFRISTGQEGLNAKAISDQLIELNKKKDVFTLFERSLNEKTNYLKNEGMEQEYYGKVEYYLLTARNEGYTSSNITRDVKIINDDLYKINTKISDLENQRNGIDISNYESKKESLNNEIMDLESKNDDSLKEIIKSKKSELQALEKNYSSYNDLNQKIESQKTEKTSKEKELKQQLDQKNNPQSQTGQMYAQIISELGTARSTTDSKITELTTQMNVYNGQENSLVVKAKNEGYVHYLGSIKLGMSVQRNQPLCRIAL